MSTDVREQQRSAARITHTASVEHLGVDHLARSTQMYALHEALARERMRDEERRSREATLARELSAQRRWHRLSRYARAAERRHARKADWTLAR